MKTFTIRTHLIELVIKPWNWANILIFKLKWLSIDVSLTQSLHRAHKNTTWWLDPSRQRGWGDWTMRCRIIKIVLNQISAYWNYFTPGRHGTLHLVAPPAEHGALTSRWSRWQMSSHRETNNVHVSGASMWECHAGGWRVTAASAAPTTLSAAGSCTVFSVQKSKENHTISSLCLSRSWHKGLAKCKEPHIRMNKIYLKKIYTKQSQICNTTENVAQINQILLFA